MQAEPAQHPGEADLDADEFEVVIGAGQHHVGDPGQPLADDVDDLGVQNVTHQQDLVVVERIGGRVDREIACFAKSIRRLIAECS